MSDLRIVDEFVDRAMAQLRERAYSAALSPGFLQPPRENTCRTAPDHLAVARASFRVGAIGAGLDALRLHRKGSDE